MKKMIICAAFVLTLIKLPFVNIGIAVDGSDYHLEDGNAAIVVEVPLYDDVAPIATLTITN